MNIQYNILGFQDPGSNWMYAIIDLHDKILFYQIIILILVLWILFSCFYLNPVKNISYKKNIHGDILELGWTLIPAFILWAIGIPSLKLLYMMDEIIDPEITIKAIGNQWYWSYEYTDYQEENLMINFDSFQIDDASLNLGQLRLLSVDNYLVLPVNTSIRQLVTSTDVIHSFAVPSLGIKLDAIPGRLNSTGLIITHPTFYFGQCSELCGFLHGMMPIGIQGVSFETYIQFLSEQDFQSLNILLNLYISLMPY